VIDTRKASTEPSSDNPDDTADKIMAVGELLWVDPRSLIVGVNIRGEAHLDKHFVADIAERGVREPITARRDAEGRLVVRKGKRRTLGAVEAGLARVRVFVEPDPDPTDADTAGQIERIVDQLGENAHRSANSDADEVRAHQELLDLGLSAGQIARRTHTPTTRVRVTTAVARSALASAVLARYDLTLDQVAVIAEFDDHTDDGVEAVKLLTVAAQKEPGQFAHVAQRLRDHREDQHLRAARIGELAETGVRILDPDNPTSNETPDAADHGAGPGATSVEPVALSALRPTAQSPSGAPLTEDAHAGCPGHAASVAVERGWRGDPVVTTTWWCTDPDGHGHAPRWDRPTGATSAGVGERSAGPMSEAEKAERRRVIANNKDWDSATTVRRDWLTGFLARKSAPKDAGRYIAATLARGGHDVRKAMENAHSTACALLGLTLRRGCTPAGRTRSASRWRMRPRRG
jgi:ParB family chromosome partitioning protein